jgi:AbrB family looped-hinge helix DNA binding protein
MSSGVNTKISEGGRVVIPAEFRRELSLEAGDTITVTLVNNEIRILQRAEAVKRTQALVRKRVSKDRSLVAELHDDRQREAANE